MKIKKCSLILFVLLIMLSSCQPTPEKSAVQSKVNGAFEQALNAEPIESVTLDVPDSIFEEFAAKTENVTITVDAKPEKPNIKTIPVNEYCPDEISSALVKRIADCFMEGQTLYERPFLLTKSELLAEIKKIEKLLNENSLDAEYGNNESMKQFVRAIEGKKYEELKKLYNDAPDTVEKKEATLEFGPYASFLNQAEYAERYAEAKYFAENGDETAMRELEELESVNDKNYESSQMWCEAVASLSGGYTGYISAQKLSTSKTKGCGVGFDKGKTLGSDKRPYEINNIQYDATPLTIGKEDAIKMTEAAIDELGYKDEFVLASAEKVYMEEEGLQSYYSVVYCRNAIQGLLTVDFFKLTGTDQTGKYRPQYGTEEIKFSVTDDGIISFSLECPLKKVRTVNSSVCIKSFDEIYEIFKQYCTVSYDNVISVTHDENSKDLVTEYADKTTVKFSDVQLAALRVVKKDDATHYYIIPVWVFKGNIVHKKSCSDCAEEGIYTSSTAVLINAVDGSIINSDDCY